MLVPRNGYDAISPVVPGPPRGQLSLFPQAWPDGVAGGYRVCSRPPRPSLWSKTILCGNRTWWEFVEDRSEPSLFWRHGLWGGPSCCPCQLVRGLGCRPGQRMDTVGLSHQPDLGTVTFRLAPREGRHESLPPHELTRTWPWQEGADPAIRPAGGHQRGDDLTRTQPATVRPEGNRNT